MSTIAYGPLVTGFLQGDQHDNGNGTVSVQKPNGLWLCVTPDGNVEERPTGGGLWESFVPGRNSTLIAFRDGGAAGPRAFVFSIAEPL